MVAIYCRVSTVRQEDGMSLSDQQGMGIEYAKSVGQQYRVYGEAVSGKSLENREAWKQLEADAEEGAVDVVWIKDATRLARDQIDSLVMWRMLDRNNAKVYMNDKQRALDYGDLTDRMLFNIEGTYSEFERERIRARAKRAMDASRESGTRAWARTYGYQRVPHPEIPGKSKWIVHEEMARTVRYIFHLFINEGLSLKAICQKVNEEGHRPFTWYFPYRDRQKGNGAVIKKEILEYSKMRRTLVQLAYIGKTRTASGEIIESQVYPRIIDDETFEQAQRLLTKAKGRSFKARPVRYLGSGVVRCSRCNTRFYHHAIHKQSGKRNRYYYHSHSVKCEQKPTCLREEPIDRILSYVYLDSMLDREMTKTLLDEEKGVFHKATSHIENSIEQLDGQIADQEEKKERIIDAIAEGTLSTGDVADRMAEIRRKLEKYREKREQLEKQLAEGRSRYDALLAEFSADNAWRFLKAPTPHQKTLLVNILESALLEGTQVTIKVATGKTYRFDVKDPVFADSRKTAKKDLLEITDDDIHRLIAVEELKDKALAKGDPELLTEGMRKLAGKA